jgi:DNA repair photolyase
MKKIISASRRTDIPAFHLDWLLSALMKGSVEVVNPISKMPYTVSLKKTDVHTLVLWSKDFGRFLKNADLFSGYHLYFLFTLNSPSVLEPRIPPLSERLPQLSELVNRFGSERVAWRFDPIVFWKDKNGNLYNNLSHFEEIAEFTAKCGLKRCITSFVSPYRKVIIRMENAGFRLLKLTEEQKRSIAGDIAQKLKKFDMELLSCCAPEIVGVEGIKKSHCIDGELLSRLAGEPCETKKDKGQRQECGCSISSDIGTYNTCHSECLYCYANS